MRTPQTTIELQSSIQTTEYVPNHATFLRWAQATQAMVHQCYQITLRVVDETESRTLNIHFRNKAGATNILSFSEPTESSPPDRVCGTLVMCQPLIDQQALQANKSSHDHWAHLTTHGLLHLSGFDHQTPQQAHKMEQLEISILSDLGIHNPYQSS